MSASLQPQLLKAADGLLYPSESEFPFAYVEWPDCVLKRLSAAAFLQLLTKPADTPIEKSTLDRFFKPVTERQDWFGEEENALANRFEELKKTLSEQLSSVQVFRLGKKEIEVYLIGKTPEGGWAGLQTTVVET